jgi:protocatechuate 3,4-dioxygenase beta subunit
MKNLTGHVTDPAGAPVAGAAVRIQATQPSTYNHGLNRGL